jgi:hypothetical protein
MNELLTLRCHVFLGRMSLHLFDFVSLMVRSFGAQKKAINVDNLQAPKDSYRQVGAYWMP